MNEITAREPKGYASFSIWVALSVLVIALDQGTKWAIVKWVGLYDKVPVNSFINITHQHNTGAAFSFLADSSGWQRWFFIGLGATVGCVILVWLWRVRQQRQLALSAGLSLVLGGAFGNVIDRIMHGYVIDFIQVLIVGWPFPSFNVADSAITVGATFLVIDALFLSGHREVKD